MNNTPSHFKKQQGKPLSRLDNVYPISMQLLLRMIYLDQAEIKEIARLADDAHWNGEDIAYIQLDQSSIDEDGISKGVVIAVQRDDRETSIRHRPWKGAS